MKPLTLTVQKQWDATIANLYDHTITYYGKLETLRSVNFTRVTDPALDSDPRMEYESQVELLHQLIPQVNKLASMKLTIIAMLTSENPNYFKHKSTIANCLNAINEAISIYDLSNYNVN